MNPSPTSRMRRAQVLDRVVAGAITAGGSLILLAVAFLMVFLVIEVLPLFRGGKVTVEAPRPSPPRALAGWQDEYRESTFVLGEDGGIHRVGPGEAAAPLGLTGVVAPLRQGKIAADGKTLAAVDAGGMLVTASFGVSVTWRGEDRVLVPRLRGVYSRADETGWAAGRVLAVAGSSEEVTVLLAAPAGATVVRGDAWGSAVASIPAVQGAVAGALARDGSQAWVVVPGELLLVPLSSFREGDSLTPLARVPLAAPATSAAVVLGDVTCLLGHIDGTVTAWHALAGDVAGSRRLALAGSFPGTEPVVDVTPSERDKSFLVRRAGSAQMAHLTSRRFVAQVPGFPSDVVIGGLAPRRDGVFAVTEGGTVHRWSMSLPHPEATVRTLLSPVVYEGFGAPELVWQTTGGSGGGFEAKLSLVPLLLGTFKGALYALLFSAPCALLAALYVSQFAPPRLRRVSKPVVEMMAALPSVVVGFLAALVLAPLLQGNLVGTLAALATLPVAIGVAGLLWGTAPLAWRRRLAQRGELAMVTAVIGVPLVLVFALQERLEDWLFQGDLQTWLLQAAGISYDQRNAVVVGFALGFAVIPIIFTLAEDAFSNVPPSLISASLALGATPWQAARTVAIPAASPGLFAAVMIGLGRAVGETMIVLMATGNTPILSLSPFNGMRTMSAAIAVELPEAPYGGTLYRVLILTALLLFALTFLINSVAVLVAARLRRRFGRLAA